MITLKRLKNIEKLKNHYKRVKSSLKTSKNFSKRVNFTFFFGGGELIEGQLKTNELSFCKRPQKVKFTHLE